MAATITLASIENPSACEDRLPYFGASLYLDFIQSIRTNGDFDDSKSMKHGRAH